MFNAFIQNIRFKSYPKKSEKYESRLQLLQHIDSDYFQQAQAAVIEKGLTLCKNNFLDEVMQWRLRYLACRLTHKEQDRLKIKIGLARSNAEYSSNFIDIHTGMLTTKYDRLGKKIDQVFPLLNPDLDLPTAIHQHLEA